MKLIVVIAFIVVAAFGDLVQAQQPPKIPRIGFLSAQSQSRSAERAAAFRQGLRELGYTMGKNIFIEYRWADGVPERLPSLAGGLAIKSRLPVTYHRREYVEEGGLMSYAMNIIGLERRAATYVDKILKGAKPAELTVEQPKKFEFIINLKAATQIGLTIPPSVLARADKIIR